MKTSNKALRMIVDNCPFGIMVVNGGHIITDVNTHGARILEYTPEEMIGTDLSLYVAGAVDHHMQSEQFIHDDEYQMRSLIPARTHALSKSGRAVELCIQIQKIDDDCAYAIFHDPVEYTPRDPLTNALPRVQFFAAIDKMQDTAYSLLFIDLNKFKEVNDNLGHRTGDMVLQTTAKRIANVLRDSDLFCRYGGDEFVIAVVSKSPTAGEIVRKKIEKLVREPIRSREHTINISCSVGVAQSSEAADIDQLIHIADERMYQEKD